MVGLSLNAMKLDYYCFAYYKDVICLTWPQRDKLSECILPWYVPD